MITIDNSYSAIYARLCVLLAKLGTSSLDYDRLPEQADLIDDIGLDSLKLIDLTVYIEDAFELAEFPMQDWIDGQVAAGRALSAGELARACQALCRSTRAACAP